MLLNLEISIAHERLYSKAKRARLRNLFILTLAVALVGIVDLVSMYLHTTPTFSTSLLYPRFTTSSFSRPMTTSASKVDKCHCTYSQSP